MVPEGTESPHAELQGTPTAHVK